MYANTNERFGRSARRRTRARFDGNRRRFTLERRKPAERDRPDDDRCG
jgi:hypothetical protein